LSLVVSTGAFIFVLTLFLDLLELSFGRILWFMGTLRFWLYFVLHFGISSLAAYLIHTKVPDWFVLAPVATILGVSTLSNTNVKIAGNSLLPVADFFVSIKSKMIEQAAQDKATNIRRGQLVERLRKLGSSKLEEACSAALMAARWAPEKVEARLAKAREACEQGGVSYQNNVLVGTLLDANLDFVEQSIDEWEKSIRAA
jgi:hypothetical protein